MPLLNLDSLIHMLSIPAVNCPECSRATYQNYCRECDEFYRTGHALDCTQHGDHAGHRIYPTLPSMPFRTRPSDWAIYLDVSQQRHVWIEHVAIEAMFGETIASQAYRDTFMEMGDRALEWIERAAYPLCDGKVYAMHFAGNGLDLRIGVVGGQVVLFTPKTEIKG